MLISRGPGHKFRPLLSTEGVFPERDTAVQAIRSILNGSLEESAGNFAGEPGMLTKELADKILAAVAESSHCSTSIMTG